MAASIYPIFGHNQKMTLEEAVSISLDIAEEILDEADRRYPVDEVFDDDMKKALEGTSEKPEKVCPCISKGAFECDRRKGCIGGFPERTSGRTEGEHRLGKPKKVEQCDFNSIADLRRFLLGHPDGEMVKQSCLHFLGDEAQVWWNRKFSEKQ